MCVRDLLCLRACMHEYLRALINDELREEKREQVHYVVGSMSPQKQPPLISHLCLIKALASHELTSLTPRLKSPGGNWTLLTANMEIEFNLSVEWAWLVVHQDD